MSEVIQKIIDEMKALDSSNKTEFNAKYNELTTKLEARNLEYDKKFGDLEKQREDFVKAQKEQIDNAITEFSKAFKNNSKGNQTKELDMKTYGKNFGEFLVKVKKSDMELKALSENVGADGGFLVPDQWSNEIQKVSLETSIFRSNGVKTLDLPGGGLKIPVLKYSSNVDGSQYGGVTAYWSAESSNYATNTKKPGFEYIEYKANKLVAFTESTEELIEDSIIAIGSFLQQCFAEVINFKEDAAFLSGDGVGKPLGVLSSPCRATVSRATASTIHPVDLVGCIARFKGDLNRAVWLVNQTTLPQLYLLQDNNGNFIFINNFNTNIQNNRTVGSLFGIPVKVSEKVPALGTEGDIGLYDLGQYIVADKSGLRVEESKDYKFNEDIRCWKLVKRVDGKPWMISPITPYKGSDTLSPFVILS